MKDPVPASEALVLEKLSKRFGDLTAVSGLDLTVERGEVFGFLGPNGAGKTTTIKMLMGILAPTAGVARIGGFDCFGDRVAVKRIVGYLPDVPFFYDYLRGREIIRFTGAMHGLRGRVLDARVDELLDYLELGDAGDDYATNYSLGMRKKLALACALVHDPPILILDEPTSGLDPIASRRIQEMIAEGARSGRTIFLSTHRLELAEKLCHRVGIIHRGELAASGAPADLRATLAAEGSLEEVFFAVTAEERESSGEGAVPHP